MWDEKNVCRFIGYICQFYRRGFHQVQNKNELHLCNSLIIFVAGGGHDPSTS